MIYPTRTAVIAAAAGAPVALAVAAVAPGRWYLALAWPLAIILLCIFDALRGIGAAAARVAVARAQEAAAVAPFRPTPRCNSATYAR